MSNHTESPVSFKTAQKLTIRAMQARKVVMLHGSPAIGKSAIAHAIAKHFGLFLIDWRGSTADPIDLQGLPDMAGDKAIYKPFDTFPINTDQIPEGYNGWLLFMDEFNSAPRSVVASAYKLVLDRMVGSHPLHSAVHMLAAGNLITDGAIVHDQGTAMASRLIHLRLEVSVTEWLEHAIESKYEPLIIAYITHRPSELYKFDPDMNEYTFPSPRTFEFASDILRGQKFTRELLPLIAGTIGDGAALNLHTFYEVAGELPSIAEISKSPSTAKVPNNPSHQYATAGMIAQGITPDNASALMIYLNRLPRELQYLTVKMFIKSDNKLLSVVEVNDWVNVNSEFLYGN